MKSGLHWLRGFFSNILRGAARDADLRADIDSYVDHLTDENIAAGMTPGAARRAALMTVGSVDAITEQTRDVRAGALVVQIWQDTRYALRLLRRDVSFSVVAILTLALGIGANTAIFSVVNTILLEPLAYRDPDRLVVVWERNPSIGKDRDLVAPLNYLDWRQSTVFEGLGAYRMGEFTLTNVPDPEQLVALSMSSSTFGVLGIDAAIGRAFTDAEERRRDRVVVLSDAFWRRRFGGDRSMVGRSITLSGESVTIVGVMPPSFEFPDGNPVDLYAPLVFTEDELNGRRRHTLMVIGRLKDDATIDRARTEIGAIARRIAGDDNTSNPEVTLAGAHDVLVEDVRLELVILMGTVGFVLLIACGNVANLLLVRATTRRREIAIRSALGASSTRLLRQLLTESVLLAVVGSAAGLVMAWSLLKLFARFHPPDLPRVEQIGIDPPVLFFVTAAALITGVVFGMVPALQSSKPAVSDITKESSRTTTASFGRGRSRLALLVAEIALSLMLLAGAGLMVRSLLKLQNVDLGFQPRGVLTAQILLAPARYPIDPDQFRPVRKNAMPVPDSKPSLFFAELEERLEALRDVEAVGAVSALPLNPVGTDFDLPVLIQGKPRPRRGEEPQSDFRVATTGYFRALGIPLLKGREFTKFDGPNSTPVVIINDAMARAMFPGEDPIGQRLALYGTREIIGVVGSIRHHGFTREPRPEMIVPYRQFQFSGMTLVVRSGMERSALAASIAGAVHAIDPDQPVYRLRSMDEFLSDSVAQARFTTLLLGGFAALALVLALIGVYGVMSYTVSLGSKDIAVRLALGARRSEVVGMIVRQGMGLSVLGVAIGLAGAAAGTRLMSGLLYGVTATDPVAFAGAAAALVLASLAATCIPALRAARVAPVTILKSE